MIDVKHVTFKYGKKKVLDDVSIFIPSKSLTAVLGQNGAGKSTLFSCLSKGNSIENGDITVGGKSIKEYSFREYSKIVSVVPQLTTMRAVDYKVRDFLVEGRTPYLSAFAVPGIEEYRFSEQIAEKMGIAKYLDANFSNLSGGEQQLILLARALVQDTPIVLLDEPMSALDLKNQAFFLKVIKQMSKEGKTILFSTHNPNHALILQCDVCIIHNNSIFRYGKSADVLNSSIVKDIYGETAYIFENEQGKFCEVILEGFTE